jgi:hypothetical protein
MVIALGIANLSIAAQYRTQCPRFLMDRGLIKSDMCNIVDKVLFALLCCKTCGFFAATGSSRDSSNGGVTSMECNN